MADPVSNGLAALGGSGFMALFVKWLIGREVDRVDKALLEHATSIGKLEIDHVSRGDITRLGEKLEITITRVADKIDAVHARIDQVMGLPPRK